MIKWPCRNQVCAIGIVQSIQKKKKEEETWCACRICTGEISGSADKWSNSAEGFKNTANCVGALGSVIQRCGVTGECDTERVSGLRRAFSANDQKKKEGGKSDERTVIKVRGQRESII